MTWKVVIVEKMLFEDSLVCHDPPSARISPSNDSLPPPCRSTAGMRVLSARFCLVEVRNHARWADFGNYVSRPGQVATSSKQDARDTVKWLTMPDVHGDDRSTTTAEHVLLSQFLFLHLVVVASSLPALSSGSLLLSERMTVSVSFSRQSQTGVLQLLEPFFTGSRSEEEGAEVHGPEDRPSAGRSSFFLLPWNCLQFVLKAFSFSRQALLACCCNTPGIHNKLAGNESDRARTAVHRPRTRWSRF